jgi:hypothetical protein
VQQERARTAELESTLAAIGDAVIVCDLEGNASGESRHPRRLDMRGSGPSPTCCRLDDPDERAPQLGADAQGPVELMLGTARPLAGVERLPGR